MLNLKDLVTKARLPQNEEGQGLVEYALILVLVAIVVIAILLLLGPVVGNVFSNVTDALSISAPANPSAPPASWTFCGYDGDTCTFTGTKEIQYGNPGKYVYTTATGPVKCFPTDLGLPDPDYGVVKSCYYR